MKVKDLTWPPAPGRWAKQVSSYQCCSYRTTDLKSTRLSGGQDAASNTLTSELPPLPRGSQTSPIWGSTRVLLLALL